MEQEKNWERQALEHLLLENLKETRKARRWKTILRVLFLILIAGFILQVLDLRPFGGSFGTERHTAMVSIEGEISSNAIANALDVGSALQAAFENDNSVGVILRINSPGGSPVQSGIINDEIRRLRALYPNKPLHVVVEDICASGGYYVAVAADRIYVDKASIVGSIGVLMDGFGFAELMDKLGVERRLITAGSNKGMLDPFSPQDARQRGYAQAMIDQVHQQFIRVVREGRGERLKETPETFSGLFWNGESAVAQGLAYGARVSLLVGVVSTLVAVIFGVLIGSLAGFYGGRTDDLLTR